MPYVDLSFSIQGTHLPRDYSYPLFSAVVGLVPEFHGNSEIGIHPIKAQSGGNGLLLLDSKSRLTIRLDVDKIKTALPLAGQTLDIAGTTIHIGVPKVFTLVPAANLHSRLVTIKGFMEPEPFQDALKRQLEEQDINPNDIEIGNRRTLKVQDKRVVGFQVQLLGLTADESLTIQEHGLGGRRRFGCGVFHPFRMKGESH